MSSTTMKDLAERPRSGGAMVANPFQSGQVANVGASAGAAQARESAEILALYSMAERFPRDQLRAMDRIVNAFSRPSLAATAEYQYARGGNDITGPSIRSAEAIAQQWGNVSSGWRELSRSVGPDGVGVSEVEAYSIDLESRTRESITFYVRHWRDTRQGGKPLRDERDIYELCANAAQRRKRACILAVIPGDVTETAMQQVAATLKAGADTSPESVRKLVEAFAPFGVTPRHIETRIQRRLDSITPAQIISLRRIYSSLRDEMSQPGDWFEVAADAPAPAPAPAPATPAPPVDQPPAEEPAPAPPAPRRAKAKDEPAAPTYAQFVDGVNKAETEDGAGMVLDEARETLDTKQFEELTAVFRRKWPAGKE